VGRPKQRKTDKIYDNGNVVFLLCKEISLKNEEGHEDIIKITFNKWSRRCGLKISVREKGPVTVSCEYGYGTSDYTNGGSCYVTDRLFVFQKGICSTDFKYAIMLCHFVYRTLLCW
jgi:hypothetical protein